MLCRITIIAPFSSLEHARALEGVVILSEAAMLSTVYLVLSSTMILLSGAYAVAKLKPRLTFSRLSVC